MILRNASILPQHYAVSQPRKLRRETVKDLEFVYNLFSVLASNFHQLPVTSESG
jgi:hypothetical protein